MEAIPTTDPAELAYAEQVRHQLRNLGIALELYESVRAKGLAAGSELAADDAATAWMQLSHLVNVFLNMAADNLRAFRDLIGADDDGNFTLPLYAHYPVLRSALEAAAHAKWILKPDSQQERVTRMLQARTTDLKRDDELHEETLKAAVLHGSTDADLIRRGEQAHRDARTKAKTKIRDIAGTLDLERGRIGSGLPNIITILRNTGQLADVPGQYVSSIWKIMSGLAHPSASRATHYSDIQILSTDSAGVHSTRMTASMNWTHQSLLVGVATFFDAIQLYDQRRSRRFHPDNPVRDVQR